MNSENMANEEHYKKKQHAIGFYSENSKRQVMRLIDIVLNVNKILSCLNIAIFIVLFFM